MYMCIQRIVRVCAVHPGVTLGVLCVRKPCLAAGRALFEQRMSPADKCGTDTAIVINQL